MQNKITYRCDTHLEILGETYKFKHLRLRHGIEAGGKTKIKRQPVDLSDISIHLTKPAICEVIGRELKFSRLKSIFRTLKSMKILLVEPEVVSKHCYSNADIFAINIPDEIVNSLWTDKLPFNLEKSLFARIASENVNKVLKYATDIPDTPEELIFNSVTFVMDRYLDEVLPYIYIYIV